MKRILLLCLFVCSAVCFYAQDSDRAESMQNLFEYNHDKFLDKGFKYDKGNNMYTFRKVNGLQATANVLNALSGVPTNYVPHKDDVYINVFMSIDSLVSSVSVTMYDPQYYDEIVEYIKANTENCGEYGNTGFAGYVGGKKLDVAYANKQQGYNQTNVRVNGNGYSSTTRSVSNHIDQSYTTVVFVVSDPDLKHWSKKLEKQEKKKKKNDAKLDF